MSNHSVPTFETISKLQDELDNADFLYSEMSKLAYLSRALFALSTEIIEQHSKIIPCDDFMPVFHLIEVISDLAEAANQKSNAI